MEQAGEESVDWSHRQISIYQDGHFSSCRELRFMPAIAEYPANTRGPVA
jgi:hypothetical protein